jgi:ribosomal protein S18 acetylase RimI-like enzyme
MDKVKGILININDNIRTEQMVLNGLYEKLVSHHFDYIEHPVLASKTLEYITLYLKDFSKDKTETFCFSKKSGKTGMSTRYLIENLDPRSKNSLLAILDKETDDVLGVLVFNYVQWSSIDYAYDNSLYISAFCTNQQLPRPGIGKLLLTSIIKAATEVGVIDNIFLEAATKDSEGFYEKFKFEPTGKIEDKMKEYQYQIKPYATASHAPYATAATAPLAPYATAAPYASPYGGKRTIRRKKSKKMKKRHSRKKRKLY